MYFENIEWQVRVIFNCELVYQFPACRCWADRILNVVNTWNIQWFSLPIFGQKNCKDTRDNQKICWVYSLSTVRYAETVSWVCDEMFEWCPEMISSEYFQAEFCSIFSDLVTCFCHFKWNMVAQLWSGY